MLVRQTGATMIEFTIVFVLVLLPALMSVFEFAQLSVARSNLRYAVFDTVRMAEAQSESETLDNAALRWRLSRALLPTLAKEATTDAAALSSAAALATRVDLLNVNYNRISEAASFETWELEVRWCRELLFAPIKYLLPSLLRLSSSSVFDQACYTRQSLPLAAKAYVLRARTLTGAALP